MTKVYHNQNHSSSKSFDIQKLTEKKIMSLQLADSYSRLSFSERSLKVRECGTFLELKQFSDGFKQLHRANFCKDRLCPSCTWRRSLKIFSQLNVVMEEACQIEDIRFLFLTLTIKNVNSASLDDAIDDLLEGFRKLMRRKTVSSVVLGSFRGLEITYNKFTHEFHPHLHVILAVNSDYFHNGYISHDLWSKMWQKCLKSNYMPIVNIKSVRLLNGSQTSFDSVKKAVLEVAKYSVKDSDILPKDLSVRDNVIWTLSGALANRRLISFTGLLKDIHFRLNLSDPEDDLLDDKLSDQELLPDVDYVITRMKWLFGFNVYSVVE